MQKPSLGRIVIVPVRPTQNNSATEAPAVITRVWSDTCVNVRVLLDGRDVDWMTSVPLLESPEALAEARRVRDEGRPDLVGTPFFGAYWPPRV